MIQPTMTNEQFALWITLSYTGMTGTNIQKADAIFNWLEAKRQKSVETKPIAAKTK